MTIRNKWKSATSTKKLKALLSKRIHILQWLPDYTKFDVVSDIIAGITLGMTMMPQSIAYAALAKLPPQYGLYSSFMGCFIYAFFGTIKEISVGPTSLMAILTLLHSAHLSIDYIILLTFLCGWVELLMGIFKLGFILDFISTPVISGFTSATAVVIILGQLNALFGIKFDSQNTCHYIQQFILHISEIKTYDLILGICCIAFLLILRAFKDVKSKNLTLKKAFWLLSISRNALIVLIASLIAYYLEYSNGKVPFALSGTITSGVPKIQLPKFSSIKLNGTNEIVPFIGMVQQLGSGIIIIPIVAISTNIAIAKAFAAGKQVDASQEMITLGLCNIFGSFVQSMPTAGALTRSAVGNASGVRTPLAGIYAGMIIILALSFLTPYFYYVPKATLSAVLISAVVFMIDYKILPKLWKCNRFDLLITITTFIVSLIYGVESGLFVGVLLNFIPQIKLWTRPKIQFVLSVTKEGSEYLKIKPELGLCYSAVDYLTEEIIKITTRIDSVTPVVIDFANIFEVDYTAIQAINNLARIFKKKNQLVLFLNVNQKVQEKLGTLMEENDLCYCKDEEDINNLLSEFKTNIDDVEIVLLDYKQPL